MIRAPRARPDVSALSGDSPTGQLITLNVIDDRNASAYWRESGVWSRSWMMMGISLTLSEIVVPSSATMPTGSASASTSASRSRRICVSSLGTWARMRFIRRPYAAAAVAFWARCDFSTITRNTSSSE